MASESIPRKAKMNTIRKHDDRKELDYSDTDTSLRAPAFNEDSDGPTDHDERGNDL